MLNTTITYGCTSSGEPYLMRSPLRQAKSGSVTSYGLPFISGWISWEATLETDVDDFLCDDDVGRQEYIAATLNKVGLPSLFSGAGSVAGTSAGTYLAGPLGGKIGGTVGGIVGKALGRVLTEGTAYAAVVFAFCCKCRPNGTWYPSSVVGTETSDPSAETYVNIDQN